MWCIISMDTLATHGLIMSILGEIPCLEGCNMNLLVGTGGRTSPGKGVFVWRRGRPVKDCTCQAIKWMCTSFYIYGIFMHVQFFMFYMSISLYCDSINYIIWYVFASTLIIYSSPCVLVSALDSVEHLFPSTKASASAKSACLAPILLILIAAKEAWVAMLLAMFV